MNLLSIVTRIYRRTHTDSTSYPAADMLISLNASYEYYNARIRKYLDNYHPTLWSAGDVTTGTLSPVFDSNFHDLIPLKIIAEYAVENVLPSASGFLNELQMKEKLLDDFYGARNYKVFIVTIAAPGVITAKAHGLISGDRVTFFTTGALPTGLAADTWYYVVSDGLAYDAFEVSAVKDGTPITTTGTQSGTQYYASDRAPRMRPRGESNR